MSEPDRTPGKWCIRCAPIGEKFPMFPDKGHKCAPAPEKDERCGECGEIVPAGDAHQHHDREDPTPAPDGGEKGAVMGWWKHFNDRVRNKVEGQYGPFTNADWQAACFANEEIAALRARCERLERLIYEIENECLHTCEDDYGSTKSCAQHIVMRWKKASVR